MLSCRNPGWVALMLSLASCPAQEVPPGAESGLASEPAQARSEARFGTTVVIPSGLRGVIYNIPPASPALPNFEKLDAVGAIYASSFDISPRNFTEGFPGVTTRVEWFAIDYTGRFYIEKPGKYRFALISDDGSKLYIDGRAVIKNDGIHPPTRKDGAANLAGGIHTIRLSYFQGPGGGIALVLGVSGPGETEFRIFSTNEFKPPTNPEDWKFGNPDDLKTPLDRNSGRMKQVKDGTKKASDN
jgi:hypothetical protein